MKERWIVYEVVDPETSEREEIRAFASPQKASEFAKQASRNDKQISVDWQLEKISRNGIEILDTDADLQTYRDGK